MVDKSKYVVLDVETNGLSSVEYDLLSISIYKPDSDEYYDRFLPLELQKEVLTTDINGITTKMLKGKKPYRQKEFNELIDKYELETRIILTYGNLDKVFIKNYLKRHKIKGFEKLKFQNIKDSIISTAYTNGLLTKDNLCSAFGIGGVQDIHSGHNDCKLEWDLFEFIDNRTLFVAYTYEFCPDGIKHRSESWYIYELTKDYLVPVSYLHSHPKIIKKLNLPKIDIQYEIIYEHSFSDKCSPEYARQPAGIASEYLIKTMLEAKYVDNYQYLLANRKKLNYLGSILAEEKETILYTENADGTIKAVNDKDELIIEAINKQTIAIKNEISPLIEFIKETIFNSKPIYTQELVINNQYKMLGLCDFSNEYGCVESKWHYNDNNKKYLDQFKYQLYITSNGRPVYIMVGSENKITIKKAQIIVSNQ